MKLNVEGKKRIKCSFLLLQKTNLKGDLKTMNKQELISQLIVTTELSKKDATLAVESVFGTIATALANGDKVSIHGFGNFEVRERAARQGVNPKLLADLKAQGVDPETAKIQAAIQIASSKAPAFKPATALKKSVN